MDLQTQLISPYCFMKPKDVDHYLMTCESLGAEILVSLMVMMLVKILLEDILMVRSLFSWLIFECELSLLCLAPRREYLEGRGDS